jgi:hypothetical protein
VKIRIILGIFLVAVTAMILAIGCSSSSDKVINNNPNTQPVILRITPANGASLVSRTASIGIKFNTPMDTTTVMSGFHFSGGPGMLLWMDSMHTTGGMMHMGGVDRDHMMQWMDTLQMNGHFMWNAALDSCQFAPDSIMSANTEYMTFMYGQIKSHGGMMMNMGGNGMMSSDTGFTYHFTTAS